ncbi:MAG: hypothetical protein AB7T63_02010 [Planctomycetota bacterium]
MSPSPPGHLVRLFALLGLVATIVASAAPARGGDEAGSPACVHGAVIERGDAGAQALYEGIRLGLERARWQRVCEELPPPDQGPEALVRRWRERFEAARARGDVEPWLFVVGEALPPVELAALAALPHVVARTGYAIAGEPLDAAVPAAPRRGVVRGLAEAAWVGERLRAWCGRERPRVLWRGAGAEATVTRFLAAAEVDVVGERTPGREGEGVVFDAVLHLRLDAAPRAPFDQALAAARAGGAPLVSDDRGRFGDGAALVLVPDHDLIGRVTADVARRLALAEEDAPRERAVSAMRTWIDLEACDRQGLDVPWGLLASTDRLRRGRPSERPR